MSDERKDGGPVFPALLKVGHVAKSEGGMSLRDWFAGQAMQGLIAAGGEMIAGHEDDAKWCIARADALIAELRK